MSHLHRRGRPIYVDALFSRMHATFFYFTSSDAATVLKDKKTRTEKKTTRVPLAVDVTPTLGSLPSE